MIRFIFIFFTMNLAAHDLFVSPMGSDAQIGSIEMPFQSIQAAISQAKPGDTIHLREGTYFEKIFFNTSGSENKPITLMPYFNEHAIISGAYVTEEEASLITIENQSYLCIKGLELRDLQTIDGSAIRVLGSGGFIVIHNNEITEIRGGGKEGGAMGITFYGTDKNMSLHDIEITENHIHHCDPAWSEALVLNGNVEQFKVLNNQVHDVNNIGIDFIGGEAWLHSQAVRDGICKGNLVFRAKSVNEGGFAAGIYVDGGRNIVVEANEVYECDLGIEVGAERSGIIAHGIEVKRNFIHHNEKGGLVFGGYDKKRGRVKNCSFTNNRLVENDSLRQGNGEIWIQYASENQVLRNSIQSNSQNLMVTSWVNSAKNHLNCNHYCGSQGKKPIFIWNGKKIIGFEAFQKATAQEADGSVCAD